MSTLYPLKFGTIYKDKIWGGQKIKSQLHKDFGSLPNCGETWEISGVPSDVSVVANGELAGKPLSALLEQYGSRLAGEKVYKRYGNDFPLLVKFIDANDDLSIQVHPDDRLARSRHNSFGKTEMWYVIQADPGATLISGFNQPLTEEMYLEKLQAGKLMEVLNRENVSAGDVFFLPAGRVHTIGKGLLIAEIQQTSDITYRIYDFDRRDEKGKQRELHTEQALAALDFEAYPEYKTRYPRVKNDPVELVRCPYFTTNILDADRNMERDYRGLDSFVIHICVGGAYSLETDSGNCEVQMGECVLLPAGTGGVRLKTAAGFKLLESYIEE